MPLLCASPCDGDTKLLASSATREGGDEGLVRSINGEVDGREWVHDLPEGLRPCRYYSHRLAMGFQTLGEFGYKRARNGGGLLDELLDRLDVLYTYQLLI